MPTDADASIMIAVTWDALIKDASAVAVVTPMTTSSVWENGRIYTYTRVHVDQGVAGELATGSEAYVRTMGGVVGKIGQSVDGEPVLTVGRPNLLFLHPGPAGSMEVSGRSQGQYAIRLDDAKTQRLARSSAVGMLLPPRPALTVEVDKAGATTQSTTPATQATATGPTSQRTATTLAQEVLHDRPLDEAVKDIASAWKRAHAK